MFLRLLVVNCALPPSEAPEFGAWHGKRFRKPIHPPFGKTRVGCEAERCQHHLPAAFCWPATTSAA